nr:hypothetical protein CFP56_78036 [Quercus suber]
MTGSAMDGGTSGRQLRRYKIGKTAAEWQLPVSDLASAVADVLSGGGQGRRGWFGLVQDFMRQILERLCGSHMNRN